MRALAQCVSHSPTMSLRPLEDARGRGVVDALSDAKRALAAFRPDIAVMFAPDHYNGFFYDLMPPFCVGTRARGLGDYGTLKGPLPVHGLHAAELHRYLVSQEFDAAVSHDMWVDHAIAQPMEQLLPAGTLTVPIFINCIADPVPTFRRVLKMGRAVGSYCREAGLRVAFIGSGGLSHDPPLPSMATVDEKNYASIVKRRELTPEERAARESRTMRLAEAFAQGGDTSMQSLSEEWDRGFLKQLESADWDGLVSMSDKQVSELAGKSAHEVRTWIASFGALTAFGAYRVERTFYAAVPEWIVGFGAMRGVSEV